MRSALTALLLAALVAVAGCGQQVRNEHAGMAVGGALGGLLGAQVGSGSGQLAATAAGALAGAFIGSRVGRTMDEVDRMRVHDALERAPTGHTVAWNNPDSGAHYEMTPTRTYQSETGPCREYHTEAWIEGRREVVTGTACREPDGTWRTV